MTLKYEILNSNNQALSWNFQVSDKSCGNHDYYESFLKFSALSDSRTGYATTHLFIDREENSIAGFCSLRMSALASKDGENHLIINHPALEIVELAVDERYEHKGIGTFIINFVARKAYILRQNFCGVKSIVLCADPKAEMFYIKNGFKRLDNTYEPLIESGTVRCVPMYFNLPENI